MDLSKILRYLEATEQSYRDSSVEWDDRASSCGYDFYEMDAMANAVMEVRKALEAHTEAELVALTEEAEALSKRFAQDCVECSSCGERTLATGECHACGEVLDEEDSNAA